jgi:uncharacterized protein YjbI with pentapeptide repeats
VSQDSITASCCAALPLKDGDGRCFAHTRDALARAEVLRGLSRGDPLSFTRGMHVSAPIFADILSALPVRGDGRRAAVLADFTGGTFDAGVHFNDMDFEGQTSFFEAVFHDEGPSFIGVRFKGAVDFRQTHWPDDAAGPDFRGATFVGHADFTGLQAVGDVVFGLTRGEQPPAVFEAGAKFDDCRLQSSLYLEGILLPGVVTVQGTIVDGVLSCSGAKFQHTTIFGPIEASQIRLIKSAFDQRIEMLLTTKCLDATGLRLPSGGRLNVPEARIDFRELEALGPLSLRGEGASLIDLRDAYLSGVVLNRVYLGECYFEGARGLETLSLEGAAHLGEPSRISPLAGRRVIIADEKDFVKHKSRRPDKARARSIAAAYRAMRQALESARNEPGAADLYYGEMEMRRAAATGVAERLLLWIYWAVAGYGLRAARAVMTLFSLILVTAILLTWQGSLEPAAEVVPTGAPILQDSVGEGSTAILHRFNLALLYATESATVVFRGPEQAAPDTLARWCQVVLRLTGPSLLALAVLALRSRFKR